MIHDRFYALLKRRLQAEIQNNPPLFPWETEILDYADVGVWATQLQRLKLPVALPDLVLAELFQGCQQVIQNVHQQGLQLIQAVEALFPNEGDRLNDFAGQVLLGASRDDDRTRTWLLGSEIPQSYEQAHGSQQMLLALMAAQELLSQATLVLSPHEPRVLRQWQTALGPLEVTATQTEPLPGQIRLDIWADLPGAGQVTLQTGDTMTTVKRDSAGTLSLVIPAAQMAQVYPLDINIQEADQPLKFVVRLQQHGLQD